MNVSSVSCAQPSAMLDGASKLSDQRKHVMEAVAKKLGMSDSELADALKSGKSLTDIAKSKGVSAADLTATIKDSLKSTNPNLSDSQLSNITDRIVKGGGHHNHHRAEGASSSSSSSSWTSSSSSSNSSSSDSSSTGSPLSVLL